MISPVKVSIIIVSYRSRPFLERCLNSLAEACKPVASEMILVDNASGDGTCEYVSARYPQIRVIANPENAGFGKACNQGAQKSQGSYLLFLNPDTVLQTHALRALSSFLDQHREAGVVGPKILNPDGSLQLACRRSFPTPSVAVARLLGLSLIFPNSRRFGKYNLTFLNPEQETQVDAVSGSCMMIRREAFEKAGGFDEDFFLYGEDLDLCHRIQSLGWKIFYTPATQIVHFKGESARQHPFKSRLSFYSAMFLFSKKHKDARHSFVPVWLLWAAISLNAVAGIFRLIVSNLPAALLDSLILNFFLWADLSLWFAWRGFLSLYNAPNAMLAALHGGFTLIWLSALAGSGAYRSRKHWISASLRGSVFATVGSLSLVYLVKSMAFSRVGFLVTSLLCCLLLPLWRWLAGKRNILRRFAPRQRILIVGDPRQTSVAAGMFKRSERPEKIGYVSEEGVPAIEGATRLGSRSNLHAIVKTHRVDELIIFENQMSYTALIDLIASFSSRKPLIRMATLTSDNRILLAEFSGSLEKL